MPIAVTAALLILLSSHAGAETPWAMEAGLWRNVTREPSDYDDGMAAIDAMVEPDRLTERARHLRALVSRFDAVEHYRAKDNLSLLVRAVGSGTYPGYPAVDVLARSWQIDEERRTWFRDWSRALAAWSRGEEVDRPLTLDGEPVQLEQLLGERTLEKAWLAASLGRTVWAFVMTPADRIDGLDAETFVRSVYRAALGRDPSPDDLRFRVRELAAGKRRAAFIDEVYGSDEARQRRVREVLGRAAEISEAP